LILEFIRGGESAGGHAAVKARLHLLRTPGLLEFGAGAAQFAHQCLADRISPPGLGIGPMLGDQTAHAPAPVDDEGACCRIEHHVMQQVPVLILSRRAAPEPPREQFGSLFVPGNRIPVPIEHVGGRLDRSEQGREATAIGRIGSRWGCIRSGRQVEQISALGARQIQSAGNGAQCGRRHARTAALLDPRVPGRTDPAQRGHLLASKSERASPRAWRQTKVGGFGALAPGAQEFAEQPAVCRGRSGVGQGC